LFPHDAHGTPFLTRFGRRAVIWGTVCGVCMSIILGIGFCAAYYSVRSASSAAREAAARVLQQETSWQAAFRLN